MVDGERRGPYLLEELPEAGLRPASWVWTKGMTDWQQAKDVPDICRLYRSRLHPHPVPTLPDAGNGKTSGAVQSAFINRFAGQIGPDELPTLEEIDSRQDFSAKPSPTLPLSVLATIIFPPMGIFSLYFSIAAKRCWKRSENSGNTDNQEMKIDGHAFTPHDWQRLAHEYSRWAKMWGGISFFLGLIFYSFIIHHFF